jgi:hypothetical protein
METKMKVLYGMTLLAGLSALAVGGPTQARPPAISPNGDVETFNVTVINNSTDFVFGGMYFLGKDSFGNDALTIDPSTFDFNRSGIVAPGQTALTQIHFTAGSFNGGTYNVDLFGTPASDLNPSTVQFMVPVSLELDADSACSGSNPNPPSYCTRNSTLPNVTIPAAAPSSVPETGGLVPFGLGALGLGFLTLKAYKRKYA